MRVLVISDIHANFTALNAVLADAGPTDEIWCLGDMVGYGPDPNEVVEKVREMPQLTCILGNHDVAVVGRMPFETFNGDARRSLLWTEKTLKEENVKFLLSLPQNTKVRANVTLAHGSPRDPLWEYVLNTLSARLNFDHFDTQCCFVGHSHIQCSFRLEETTDRVFLETPRVDHPLELHSRMVLNPGSVGQPRDRNPHAAYAIYDSEAHTWTPCRATYDVASVQARIRAAGLPEKHALRLAEGW
jgi:predicted phosphodiesterase